MEINSTAQNGTKWQLAEKKGTKEDIPEIIKGANKQQRLLSVAPKKVDENDLNQILIQSMENW